MSFLLKQIHKKINKMYSPLITQRPPVSILQVPAFLYLLLPTSSWTTRPSGIQYPRQHWLVSVHLAGKGVSQIEETLEIRAIAPPRAFAVHPVSADPMGMLLQIAARRERKICDFMAYCFFGMAG